jgi:hypothetical protein
MLYCTRGCALYRDRCAIEELMCNAESDVPCKDCAIQGPCATYNRTRVLSGN